MLAEFAARMNCGGTDVSATASFMRQMMHSVTRPSYDNVIATQTFGDEEDEEVMRECCAGHNRTLALQHLSVAAASSYWISQTYRGIQLPAVYMTFAQCQNIWGRGGVVSVSVTCELSCLRKSASQGPLLERRRLVFRINLVTFP